MSRTELLITTQPHQKGACTGVWEWRYPNPPAGGHGLLLPSHPNDFRKSCSHALLPPVPDTTNPVSPATCPLSVLGSRTAELQLLLTLCSTPSTAACFWRWGGQKFSPGHCTKACVRQGTLGSKPAQQTVMNYMQRLNLRNGIMQNGESVPTPHICAYWKVPLLQPPKKVFPSLEQRLFLTMYFSVKYRKVPSGLSGTSSVHKKYYSQKARVYRVQFLTYSFRTVFSCILKACL